MGMDRAWYLPRRSRRSPDGCRPFQRRTENADMKLCGDLSDCVDRSGGCEAIQRDRQAHIKAGRLLCDNEETGNGCRVAAGIREEQPARFRPWQQVWQCNDIRVTVTKVAPNDMEYDIGGTIWGGSRFFKPAFGPLHMNGRPMRANREGGLLK